MDRRFGSGGKGPSKSAPTFDDQPPIDVQPTPEPKIPSGGQENAAKKQAYLNEMPIEGPWPWAWEQLAKVGFVHKNVSVESPDGVVTSGMGGGTSLEQSDRNRKEAQRKTLKQTPMSEAYGGRYKDVDVEKLDQQLKDQVSGGKSTGLYGLPNISEEGHPSLNICWQHATDNLHRALPPEAQARNRQRDCENFDELFYKGLGGS